MLVYKELRSQSIILEMKMNIGAPFTSFHFQYSLFKEIDNSRKYTMLTETHDSLYVPAYLFSSLQTADSSFIMTTP